MRTVLLYNMRYRTTSTLRPSGVRTQGFTLIEVMFSVVFLAAGLLGIAALEDIALARNVDARRITAATNVATEMLERIRFNSPLNATAYPTAPIPPVPALPTGGGYLYHGIVACSQAPGVPAAPPTACSAAAPPPCIAAQPANAGNTGASAPANTAAGGDYTQWAARLAQVDSNGVPLLPCAIGTVTSAPVGPPSLGQVQVTVAVQWTAGVRTPTVVMSTIVAPL
jgi:Tfp pilus assembly protein PilV